jgi:hypothetical protein
LDIGATVTVTTTRTPPDAVNLIPNPSFENPITGWNPTGAVTMARVAGVGRNGGHAMALSAAASGDTSVRRSFPVKGGTSYEIRGWRYFPRAMTAQSLNGTSLQVVDNTGANARSGRFDPIKSPPGIWYQSYVPAFKTGAAATSIEVRLYTPVGTVYWDEIFLVETANFAPDSVRFVGKITDINQGWDDAGAATPEQVTLDVIATGALADLGRRVVGAAPFGQQLDGARVAAVMAAAGITLDPLYSDPGTVQILPRDIDAQPALDVAAEAATASGGIVWATRDGLVRYADANHRKGTAAALTLDACDVLVTPTWARTTAGLVNDVSIGYGVAPEGADQPRYTAARQDSKDIYGVYGFEATTPLAALADASAMGQLLLVRNRVPVWIMSELPVDMDGLSADDTTALLGLDMHALIGLTGLPATGPTTPTNTSLWVEGWTEALAWRVHDFVLTVSGYCRTVPPPQWDNLASSLTWDTVTPPAMTWDDATCTGPLPSENRWNDVPASQRWDQLATSVTWQNYTTG